MNHYVAVPQFRVTAEIQRPNDAGTVAYAQYDVVGSMNGTTALFGTLRLIAEKCVGGVGYINHARLVANGTNGAGSNMSYRVFLYAYPPTPIADNSPWTLLYANMANRIGWIDFDLNSWGANSDSASDQQQPYLRFFTGTASQDIYYVITMRTARLAPANEKYSLELTGDIYQ